MAYLYAYETREGISACESHGVKSHVEGNDVHDKFLRGRSANIGELS